MPHPPWISGAPHLVQRTRAGAPPWTLRQSSWAAEPATSAPPGPLLELCCGAGQIGLATVAESGRRLVCIDADPVACEYTRLKERFAGVVADPPWVPRAEVVRYPEDPVTAIDGGPDGLDLARACLATAARHLMTGGFAVLQVGTTQQPDRLVAELHRYGGALRVHEVREYDRGTLMRLDRV